MNVKNCSRCGKIFTYTYGPVVCDSCANAEEEDFQMVKEYVWGNPKCSTLDVAAACDIPVMKILTWLREGRLQVADDSPLKIRCEKCDAIISSGSLCEKCALEARTAIRDGLRKEATKKGIQGTSLPKTREEKIRYIK